MRSRAAPSAGHAAANFATASFGPTTPGSEPNTARASSSSGPIAAWSSISERIRLCGGVRIVAPTTRPPSSTTAKYGGSPYSSGVASSRD